MKSYFFSRKMVVGAILFLVITGSLIPFSNLHGQASKKSAGYIFSTVKELPATAVKNQSQTNTCWSFSVISMLESELIRMGQKEYNLSEMFVVHNIYKEKAEKYVRMHGTINFSGGGFFHDVLHAISTYGIVPEEIYTGLGEGELIHDHSEMDDILEQYVNKVVNSNTDELESAWKTGFTDLIDSCLGKLPEEFIYENISYTPEKFASYLNLNMEDYVEITSFSHHPFYQKFILEVPDNWAWGEFFNVPLDELVDIIINSVLSGYTVAWSADVSDKGFSWSNGVAMVPDIAEGMTINLKDGPVPEKKITQELRQEGFDNYTTTDDHGMQIIGLATDQYGNKYFKVKNSWGLNGSPYNGYLYVSESYVRYKTLAIMVNKKGIPSDLRDKLNID